MILADIEKAAAAIEGAVERTPFLHSLTLSSILGAEIFVKFENLQFTGSFKERGALNKLLSLNDAERSAGVIAMSAGNHAQAVAWHAQRLGIPATIVMPEATPFIKVRQTEVLGATVILKGKDLSEAAAFAERLSSERGLAFVHPYDDPAVIAGQGTVAMEMLADQPDLDDLVIPIGGGGLISGVAVAARALKPDIRITGVEAAGYPSMRNVLEGIEPKGEGATVAEGIAVKEPGQLTRQIVRDLVDEIIVVSETSIENAISLYVTIEKTVAEGAGAASLAAIVENPARFAGRRIGVLLSGGNIDPRILATVLMRDLVREGRIARLRIEIVDDPGALAEVAGIVGEQGGNILEVYHQRLFSRTVVKKADLDIVVETRDPEQMQSLAASLKEAGFPVRLLDASDAGD